MNESSDKESAFGLSADQIRRLLSIGSDKEPVSAEPCSSTDASGDKHALSAVEGSESSLQIDGYEVIEKVAEAGQGQVWRALQRSTGRDVAIKVPKVGSVTSERARVRFEREIELAARLKHPNIARIYDSGVDRGQYYYVMDFVEGLNLNDYVKQHDLTHRQILELMKTICQSVQHAHQNGVIHRDLKPSNIIVTEDGRPFIVDFGLAKGLLEDDQNLVVSMDGETVGTPAYMSPEQAAGHTDKVDTRTDVYSLGVTLFTLLTGSNPHDLSGSRIEVIHRIANEEVRRPRSLNRNIDKDIEALLLKALDRNPDRRYSSAAGLTEDIDNYLKGEPLIAGSQSNVYRLKKFVKRNRLLVMSIAVILVVFIGGLIASSIFAIGRIRARAESQAINDFLTNELLASTNPFSGNFPELTVMSLIDSISTRLEDEFEDRPLVKASILHSLGKAYWWHGKPNEAEVSLEQALQIYQQKLGEKDPKTLESMFSLELIYREQDRDEQAQSFNYKVLESLRPISGENDELACGALNELSLLGIEQYRRGAYEKACATLTDVEKFNDKFGSDTHVSVIAFLAMSLHQLGRKKEAQGTFNQLLGFLEDRGSAVSDFVLATPTILSATINSSATDSFPCISADGLSLYFASNRTTGLGGHDLYVATRETKSDDWGKPMNLGPTVNSSYDELLSCISPDGLLLYFNSNRPGGSYSGWWDAWVVRRETLEDDWSEPINLGPIINGPGGAGVSHTSADGLSLLFLSWQDRPGGYGWCDGWLVTRATRDDDWEEPVNLGPPINTSASEHCTGVSADELVMFFSSGCLGPARPGGAGGGDLWISTRSGKNEPWREPMNLGPTVNTCADELSPNISADSSTLYYCAGRHGGFGNIDLWQVSLVSIVDINGNKKIDVDDLCKLAQSQFHNE